MVGVEVLRERLLQSETLLALAVVAVPPQHAVEAEAPARERIALGLLHGLVDLRVDELLGEGLREPLVDDQAGAIGISARLVACKHQITAGGLSGCLSMSQSVTAQASSGWPL